MIKKLNNNCWYFKLHFKAADNMWSEREMPVATHPPPMGQGNLTGKSRQKTGTEKQR